MTDGLADMVLATSMNELKFLCIVRQRYTHAFNRISLTVTRKRSRNICVGLSFLVAYGRNVKVKCDSGSKSRDVLSRIPVEVLKRDVIHKPRSSIYLLRLFKIYWDAFRTCMRFIQLSLLFTPIVCMYPLTFVSASLNTQWMHILLWALERSGPTFVKLGQWASTRRDLFSAEFCDLFTKLHSHSKVHSWYYTKYKLRKAFGKHWRLLFEKFEKVPIGSGCVGQVHRAYMCSDMIPDESILDDVLSTDDSDDPEIDFAQGNLKNVPCGLKSCSAMLLFWMIRFSQSHDIYVFNSISFAHCF